MTLHAPERDYGYATIKGAKRARGRRRHDTVIAQATKPNEFGWRPFKLFPPGEVPKGYKETP